MEHVMAFQLSSPAFTSGAPIPARYTGDGDNVSPPLQWQDPPPETESFALMLEDPDAPNGTFHHWCVFNIGRTRRRLREGLGTAGEAANLATAVNDYGNASYDGPQPPRQDGMHHYHFKLLALDVQQLPQRGDVDLETVWREAENHAIARTELIGTYER
jgi:hypothetical protein